MYNDNELLFPAYVIPKLKDLRGLEWRKLVERVAKLPEDHPESLAFSLMMMRLDGCINCETDSFKAMRGCALCAMQNIRRFKGRDSDLLRLYQQARQEVAEYLGEQEAQRRKAA
jgi:DNA-binding ferritin-like protein (Dps family)